MCFLPLIYPFLPLFLLFFYLVNKEKKKLSSKRLKRLLSLGFVQVLSFSLLQS